MKDRIIEYLSDFAQGESKELGLEIQAILGLEDSAFRERSKEVLSGILHQYSHFSISTIDAFFQRVIRSFTRESGLLGNFRLEVEKDIVLHEVITKLMDELGEAEHKQLTEWVIQFSKERLTEGESWNITEALAGFSEEIFKESFKAIEDDILRVQEEIPLPQFLRTLRDQKSAFLAYMKARAEKALKILEKNSLSVDDFSNKGKGTAYKYFLEFANERYMVPTKTVKESSEDEFSWTTKTSPRRNLFAGIALRELMPLLKEMLDHDAADYIRFNSLDLVEKYFYYYGLISDITRKLKDYKAENNMMLLSDASHFLNGIINQSDTPFIYEKVGSFYRHYLIDEFQDTSILQWNNFRPLLREALDQNSKSLVVGDVKQSIYRWRGGDLGLLQQIVEAEIGTGRTEKNLLNKNFRSAENLVEFNNSLFSTAAISVSQATEQPMPEEVFHDIRQVPVKLLAKGFVRVEFLEKGKDEDAVAEQALDRVPKLLEEFQAQGIALRDIAILVRKNEEGQRIATHLLQYKNSPDAKPDVHYDVVSNESLRLDAAASILLLISALKYLVNPDDAVARGELVYEYLNQTGLITPIEAEKNFSLAGKKKMHGLMPEELGGRWQGLVKLSLFELIETLIRIFKLGESKNELAYLQSFQDLVLEFSHQEKNDAASFLEWWEEIKGKRSIQVAANTNAVSIYTLHKAKGLQFKYVIIPFCNWKVNHEPLHSPLLWCKSDEEPFNQLGYVAVRYKSKLEESYFANDYRQEFTKTHLDNLNLLYVAFTRAEEGMIVMAPKPAPKKNYDNKINNVGQLVYESIIQTEDLLQHYNETTGIFSNGIMESLAVQADQKEFIPVELDHYRSSDWRKKLVIKREGREFFRKEKSQQRQRVNYGLMMHKALSMIHIAADVEVVLKKLNLEGVIMEEEAKLLFVKIDAMMEHPVIGKWFTKEWQVRTEAPIIIPGGTQSRLDRVIWKEISQKKTVKRKAIIIDYKTGEKKAEDRRQVEEYSKVLSQMGYWDVEAFLLYLDDLEVVSVVSKMNLNLEF